ncbi:MAG: hypothetical protein WD845_08915 [Pirellulales bacterium]
MRNANRSMRIGWGAGRYSAVALMAALFITASQAKGAGPVKRARPPQFSKEVTDAFLPDALEKLVGPRPQRPGADDLPTAAADRRPDMPRTTASDTSWPTLIAAEALEDEIKAQQRALGLTVENPLKFKAGGYQNARLHLSVLAAMFAIDAEYGQAVRWQREAAAVRDLLAQAGFNCKVGSDASYQDAKARADELQMLVRGGTMDAPTAATEVIWPRIADRAPLMKRLEVALEERLSPGVSNPNAFANSEVEMAHEAQMIAALAAVIAREGYEFADDESYRELAAGMGRHALAARNAIAEKNYELARQSVGEISKSCASCHEAFRN